MQNRLNKLGSVIGRLSIGACLLALCSARIVHATYSNPLVSIANDPDVSYIDSSYHMITGNGAALVYRNSTDLVHWSGPTTILTVTGANVWTVIRGSGPRHQTDLDEVLFHTKYYVRRSATCSWLPPRPPAALLGRTSALPSPMRLIPACSGKSLRMEPSLCISITKTPGQIRASTSKNSATTPPRAAAPSNW